jgi:hypothetical protein
MTEMTVPFRRPPGWAHANSGLRLCHELFAMEGGRLRPCR